MPAGADGADGIKPEDLAAEVVGVYRFSSERGRKPVAVRAFNPTRERDGYEPLGSVLETNTDDWPFLVDSVSAALEARGERVVRLVHPIFGVSRARTARSPASGTAQRDPPRVGDALRPRAPARRRARRARGRRRDVLTAVRNTVGDFRRDDPARRVDDVARNGRRATTRRGPRGAVDFLAWLLRGTRAARRARTSSDDAYRVIPARPGIPPTRGAPPTARR